MSRWDRALIIACLIAMVTATCIMGVYIHQYEYMMFISSAQMERAAETMEGYRTEIEGPMKGLAFSNLKTTQALENITELFHSELQELKETVYAARWGEHSK